MIANLVSFGATDTGSVRNNNEDCFFSDDALGLYIVADGMGGHPNGEDASRLATDEVERFIRSAITTVPAKSLRDLVNDSILAAHDVVAAANAGAADAAMGTTLTVLLLTEHGFVIGNVGDSRGYLIAASADESQRLAQLTQDDTLDGTVLLKGLPPAVARRRLSTSLTQALGLSRRLDPHLAEGVFHIGDTIVLCSDGVTDYAAAEDFSSIAMAKAADPKAMVESLIAAALDGGGGDNCTCLCVTRRG